MITAIQKAYISKDNNEIPVGAVIVQDRKIISAFGNEMLSRNDPTAHAEILTIRDACKKLKTRCLINCDMFVTLEPCPMCAQAISFSRIRRLYFGAYDTKGGGIDHGAKIFNQTSCHHNPEIYGGIYEEKCNTMLKEFFKIKRNKRP